MESKESFMSQVPYKSRLFTLWESNIAMENTMIFSGEYHKHRELHLPTKPWDLHTIWTPLK